MGGTRFQRILLGLAMMILVLSWILYQIGEVNFNTAIVSSLAMLLTSFSIIMSMRQQKRK
ncbi:hypothetical protein [Pararhodonellum marinum]|uniref:hypothetical protein n=1 Tax=Pararhodonellum marinum TaxID=2755358 RepID=UPI00188FBC9A|nr:hypothetical protein [Pararhodonellum marinum]